MFVIYTTPKCKKDKLGLCVGLFLGQVQYLLKYHLLISEL